MLPSLFAALSLASTLAVPYLPQTEALCGGAAAAMVFRYWGDAHADPGQFAPLVDRRAGGIAESALVAEVNRRGWNAQAGIGSLDSLRARVGAGVPVIVLLEDRRDRYHYVVVTAVDRDRVVLHDPSWGPSREIPAVRFEQLWKPAGYWQLTIVPGDSAPARTAAATTPIATATLATADADDACAALLRDAIADIQRQGLSVADEALNRVRARCPHAAGPLRELAGLRFAQKRWSEASARAREALALDRNDAYAWDVLGSSLFMQDDAAGALRAWNRIGKPHVNLVRIEGLKRSRYQTIAQVLDLRPNELLTAERFERARRRLDELPDRVTARLAVRPESDGYATIDVVVLERATRPSGTTEWAALAARSAIDREIAVHAPGGTGQAELWTATWRWWTDRPRVGLSFAAPHPGVVRGIWRVDLSWDRQEYRFAAENPRARESRLHGGLTVTDWLTGSLKYSLTTGVDRWAADVAAADRVAALAGGTIERHVADTLAIVANASYWAPIVGADFHAVGVQALFRSGTDAVGWVYRANAGIERASDDAPLAIWAGAGEGRVRMPLLRAHPLLDGGIVDAGDRAVFGRTVTHATIEAQRWLEKPALARIAVAGFADAAHAGRRGDSMSARTQVDVGAGVRLKVPGWEGILRVDAAHGVRDGRNAVTIGWMF